MKTLFNVVMAVIGGYLTASLMYGLEYHFYLTDLSAGSGTENDHVTMMLSFSAMLGIVNGTLYVITEKYPIPAAIFTLVMLGVGLDYLEKCGVTPKLAIAINLAMFHIGLALGWSSDFLQRYARRKLEERN